MLVGGIGPTVLERLQLGGRRRVMRWLESSGLAGVERVLERWASAIGELTGEA